MEFHGIRRAPFQMTHVPQNSMLYSMEVWCRQVKYQLVPWNSMKLWDCYSMAFYPGWTSKGYSIEFHGTLESPNKKSPSSMGCHEIRWASLQMTQVFHGIPWNIPWNSMELCCRQMTYHSVPWNSMEDSMEFHGTLVSPNEVSLSSMEFHGTLRLPFYGIFTLAGLPRDIPWNSIEYFMEFHGTLVPPNDMSLSSMEFHGTFHGIPWNFASAK